MIIRKHEVSTLLWFCKRILNCEDYDNLVMFSCFEALLHHFPSLRFTSSQLLTCIIFPHNIVVFITHSAVMVNTFFPNPSLCVILKSLPSQKKRKCIGHCIFYICKIFYDMSKIYITILKNEAKKAIVPLHFETRFGAFSSGRHSGST